MTLVRRDPANDLLGIAEEMNRLVGNVFGGARETSLFKGSWMPSVDISEDNDNFYIHAELPGLSKDDVHINYEEGVLTLKGEKKTETEEKDKNYHRVERSYGAFERSFRVPSRIDVDKINARFENGVLSITLPKLEEAKPKEIKVSIK
ncbi:MAG TPA: Hsp20/alpha crystallin family protein [Bacteroidetes bacterium]|nr:Hsp20/alpha crystallin family protein [Bacteroidota bacterium]